MSTKTLSILGSTGSIGTSTIDLVTAHPDQFKVRSLTAGQNIERLVEQARLLKPDFVAIADDSLYHDLKNSLHGTGISVGAGHTALLEAASVDVDLCMAAIVGMAGLSPLLAALPHTRALAIANKEPLVAAGPLVLAEAAKHNVKILPVDSEHNAIFQVFENHNRDHIKKLILTASGGPFRTWEKERIAAATPAQAINHPNWSMGKKISVDSASMMNKALEIIEAHYLFDMPADRIEVTIHPQSLIHSMVEYTDGSILAQLGAPDMRTPIAYALAWPARMTTCGKTLDWKAISRLDFEEPDTERFPALRLAYDALRGGQAACIGFNAANEVAVSRFLNGEIAFGEIMGIVETGLDYASGHVVSSLDDVINLDEAIRQHVQSGPCRRTG